MKASKKVLGLIAVFCATILPIALAMLYSKASPGSSEATLYIDPPLVSFDTLVVGKRFDVNVTVANVTSLKSYQLKLSYNTVMLDVVGVVFLPDANLPVGNFAVNDTTGVIRMSAVYDGSPITTSTGVALATITFKTMNRGVCPLHLYDVKLSNSSGGDIPFTTEDGLVLILRHDVAITAVTLSTTETYVGNVVKVNVTSKNLGDIAENFTVKVYHGNTLFGTFDVINLASNASTTTTFDWNTGDVAAGYSYTIKANATIVPGETNTANNQLVDGTVKVKLIGDVNNDNVVDINDLNAWDAAYGTHPSELHWNLQADINSDGVVDNADGIIIIEHYHETP